MAFFWMLLSDPNIQTFSIGIAVFFFVKYIFEKFFNVKKDELIVKEKEKIKTVQGNFVEEIVKKEEKATEVFACGDIKAKEDASVKCCSDKKEDSCCQTKDKNDKKEDGCCQSKDKNDKKEDSCCKTKDKKFTKKAPKKEDFVKSGPVSQVTIIYGTTTGKSEYFAKQLEKTVNASGVDVEVINAAEFGGDPEDRMTALGKAERRTLLVIIMSTYEGGTPPESAKWFYDWIIDFGKDFRVQHSLFKGMDYAVFGLGDSLYAESGNYNTVAKNLDKTLHMLSASRLHPLGLGDENVAESKNGGTEGDWEVWSEGLVGRIQNKSEKSESTDEGIEDATPSEESDSEDDVSAEEEDMDDGLVDLEDIGTMMKNAARKKQESLSSEPKEMVTPMLKKSLTKQGYKIIGSHSGVKLCRWTKAMLRGRGGCYKHTFYGIESHRCMETTPSLACANKCVFCWRHHSNPVGTEWRWQMDSAEFILQGALDAHYKMINEFKGVPGVLPDKLAEGMQAKHCALSLVGEPIMYPEINKYVKLLHSKGISSFLVTNAQFPDAIKAMGPCTQTYVSIDASTKESLKKIDRPLFKDFWERFISSLEELAKKGQRTVYRLTLVKGMNAEEIKNYAELVALGNPDIIEIKGVTFCGSSKASSLTMENVPWHDEVLGFVQDFTDRLPDYEIASEHEHSNCVLVAHKKFRVDGVWNTWIDYDKFHQLVQRHYATDGAETFGPTDYMAPTPLWAVYGANERGFDPKETRWHRKGKREENVDGGCG